MNVYRTYFEKNNTIVYNHTVNTGRNAVCELFYGSDTFGNYVFSRFIFSIDLTNLKTEINEKNITIDSNTKHYIKMKNTQSFDIQPYLTENMNLKFGEKVRTSSFDLELYQLPRDFDEGTGYDFSKNIIPFENEEKVYMEEASNWFNRTTQYSWEQEGAFISGSTLLDIQHFDKGNEDILFNITDLINNLLTGTTTGFTSGTTTNVYNFIIKFPNYYENLDTIYPQYTGFFTRHTQTFFEPFLETQFNDSIQDDRADFYLDKINRLYLYANIKGELVNLDQLPICKVDDVDKNVYQQGKGIYYVEVLFDSNTYVDYKMYYDNWSGLLYNGISLPDVKLRFTTKPVKDYYQIGSDTYEQPKYGISLSGIKRDEIIIKGERRKLNLVIRKPYTVNDDTILDNVYYKLYVKQGANEIPVIDWNKVSMGFTHNYFIINTEWLLPQEYFIDIKVVNNGEVNIYKEKINFYIGSELNY